MFKWISRLFGREAEPRTLSYRQAKAIVSQSPDCGKVIILINPLSWSLANLEKRKGSPLTQSQVNAFRDHAACLLLDRAQAEAYHAQHDSPADAPRIDPERCWEDWQQIRHDVARSMPQQPCKPMFPAHARGVDPVLGTLEHHGGTNWHAQCIFPPTGSQVTLLFDAPDTGPNDENRRHFQKFVSRYSEYEPRIAAVLFDYYSGCRDDGLAEELPDFPTDIMAASEVWRSASLEAIHFDEDGTVTVSYGYNWDHEHDYSFRITNWVLDEGMEQ